MQLSWISENVSNVKDREAERAKALAHAAKFAHQRRKLQLQREQVDFLMKYGLLSERRSNTHAHALRRRKDLSTPHPLAYRLGLDCYRSVGLELNPRSRQIFEFLRSSYAASLNLTDGMAFSPWITKCFATQVFQVTMSNAKDALTQAAEELPYGLAFAKLPGNEHLRSHLWECKAMVMRNARSVLELTDTQAPIESLIAPVLQLFVAAVADSNMAEASLHGSTLRALLLRKLVSKGPSSFDPRLFDFILIHDFQFAQVTSAYTNFDPDFWIPTCAGAAVDLFADYLKPFYESYRRRLQLTPRSPTLYEICLDIHKWLWLWCVKGHPELLRHMGDTAATLTYFSLAQSRFQARLSNHFVWARNQLLEISTDQQDPKGSHYLRTEAIMSLGILAYLATFVGNPVFNKCPIWRKVEVFLSHLQSLLLGEAGSSATYRVDDEVVLFGYWVGGTWEHSEEMEIQHQPKDWFSRGFVRESRRMSLATWRSVKPVLDRICLSDFARPPGSLWVDNAFREQKNPS